MVHTCQSAYRCAHIIEQFNKVIGLCCEWSSTFSPEVPWYPSKSWRNRPITAGSTAQGLAWDWQQQVLASSPTLPVSMFWVRAKLNLLLFFPHYFTESIVQRCTFVLKSYMSERLTSTIAVFLYLTNNWDMWLVPKIIKIQCKTVREAERWGERNKERQSIVWII